MLVFLFFVFYVFVMEFVYLVFIRVSGESYRGQFGSLL